MKQSLKLLISLTALLFSGCSLVVPQKKSTASSTSTASSSAATPTPTPIWGGTKIIGGAGGMVGANASATTTDSAGNVYILQDTDIAVEGLSMTGTRDFVIKKYNSSGAKVWTRMLGGAGGALTPTGVAVDGSLNVYVLGKIDVDIDGNVHISDPGCNDGFITKYNSAGTKQWTRTFGQAGAVSMSPSNLLSDSSGNLSFAVNFSTSGTFGGHSRLSASSETYILRYDNTGTLIGTQQLAVSGTDVSATSLVMDASGNYYISGAVSAGTLDGNAAIGTLDFFLVKYDSTLTKQWTRRLGGAGTIYRGSNSVSVDTSGNVYTCGRTNGTFDGHALIGNEDVALIKYNATGTKQWSNTYGSAGGNVVCGGLANDTSGNLYFGGYTTASVFGLTQAGAFDGFLVKFNTAGTSVWAKSFGVSGIMTANTSLGIDSSDGIFGSVLATGAFDGNASIGNIDVHVMKHDAAGIKQ